MILAIFLSSNVLANIIIAETECIPFGKNNRHSISATLKLIDSTINLETKMYSDNKCKIHTITGQYNGIFTQKEASFTHYPNLLTLTLHQQEIVNHYNNSNIDGCGIKNWELNVSREISGLYCRPFNFPNYTDTLFDIVSFEDSKLRFGAIPISWSNTTLVSRPSSYSPIYFYLK